jgi:hypothetical protein
LALLPVAQRTLRAIGVWAFVMRSALVSHQYEAVLPRRLVLVDVRAAPDCVAKLGQWVFDRQKWAIMEPARAVS